MNVQNKPIVRNMNDICSHGSQLNQHRESICPAESGTHGMDSQFQHTQTNGSDYIDTYCVESNVKHIHTKGQIHANTHYVKSDGQHIHIIGSSHANLQNVESDGQHIHSIGSSHANSIGSNHANVHSVESDGQHIDIIGSSHANVHNVESDGQHIDIIGSSHENVHNVESDGQHIHIIGSSHANLQNVESDGQHIHIIGSSHANVHNVESDGQHIHIIGSSHANVHNVKSDGQHIYTRPPIGEITVNDDEPDNCDATPRVPIGPVVDDVLGEEDIMTRVSNAPSVHDLDPSGQHISARDPSHLVAHNVFERRFIIPGSNDLGLHDVGQQGGEQYSQTRCPIHLSAHDVESLRQQLLVPVNWKRRVFSWKVMGGMLGITVLFGWLCIVALMIQKENWQIVLVAWLILYSASHLGYCIKQRLDVIHRRVVRLRIVSQEDGETSVLAPAVAMIDEKQDKPPSYAEVLNSEQPPPSYATVVADTIHVPNSSSVCVSHQMKEEEEVMSSTETTIEVESTNVSRTEGQENEGNTLGIAEEVSICQADAGVIGHSDEVVVTGCAKQPSKGTVSVVSL